MLQIPTLFFGGKCDHLLIQLFAASTNASDFSCQAPSITMGAYTFDRLLIVSAIFKNSLWSVKTRQEIQCSSSERLFLYGPKPSYRYQYPKRNLPYLWEESGLSC
jgi:hypothetical protein